MHFETYEDVKGMRICKKVSPSLAIQIHEPFTVMSLEGLVVGKAGDYLMKGPKGELYINDKAIFEQSYTFIKDN